MRWLRTQCGASIRQRLGRQDWMDAQPSCCRAVHNATDSTATDALACSPAEPLASAAVEAGSGPVAAAVDAISGLQAATGLPWWATLVGLAAGVRLALLPLSVQQLRATAANAPLLRQAMQRSAEQPPLGQAGSRAQRLAAEFRALRRQAGAPSPAWIIAAPLVQLPVFLTAVLAVRRLAAAQQPGLREGGLAWFADLTQPALALEPISAPLGSAGVLLPAAVVGLMLANVNQAFGRPQPGSAPSLALALSSLRLLLEWLALPLFAVSMQLPQAVLLYWASSSALALGQGQLLRSPAARAWLGLQPRHAPAAAAAEAAQRQAAGQQPKQPGVAAVTASQAAAALQALGQDVPALFQQAAEWRASGDAAAAAAALERILELEPGNARAWFARGQVLAALQQWQLAEDAYMQAAGLEAQPLQLARAWLGAGVAATRDGDPDSGLQAFRKAAAAALPALESLGQAAPAPEGVRPAEALLFAEGRLWREGGWAAEQERGRERAALRGVAAHALLSQGSVLQQQGRLQEAAAVVGQAAAFDARAGAMLAALRTQAGMGGKSA